MEQNIDLKRNGEIILYQPDSSIRLEVRMEMGAEELRMMNYEC